MMNNENGRSMVEMLGVLAIIGVLSVAGIASYSMAMKKFKANEILNAASQTIILAESKAETSGEAQTAFTAENVGYTSKIGGIDPDKISVNTANHTVTITGSDLEDQIEAASGCIIGNYKILAGSTCTS